MRGLVSPIPLRRSYRTQFRVFSGEAVYSRENSAAEGQVVTLGEGWVPLNMAVLEPEGAADAR